MVAPLALMGFSTAANVVSNLVDAASSSSGAAGSKAAAATGSNAKLRKTAKDFESVFLEQTFDRLAAGGQGDGPLGDAGTGGGVYRSMLVKEYAGQVVQSGGVGIADSVYRQMLQMQEGAARAG